MSEAALLPPARHKRPGLTPRQERGFNLLVAGLMGAMVLGWIVSIASEAPMPQMPPIATPNMPTSVCRTRVLT